MARRKPLDDLHRNRHILPKIAIMIGLGIFLFGTAAQAEEGSLGKIFHVYVDGEHIGKVNDKQAMKDIMESKVKNKKADFNNLSLTIGEEVNIVPERVFDPSYDNQKVSTYLQENLSVQAEAVKMEIGGKSVGYFQNKKAAEQTLNAYQTNFVDEQDLETLTAKKQENDMTDYTRANLVNDKQTTDHLSAGDTIITDVSLSDKVSFSEQKTAPSGVLTKKQGISVLEKGTPVETVHKVNEGETLVDIAKQHDLTLDELLNLNEELKKSSVLQIGQKLYVTDYQPFVDVIVKKEIKEKTSIDYKTKTIESDNLYKGEENVKQQGEEGQKMVHYSLTINNGNESSRNIINEKTTKEPVKKIIVKGTKVVPSRGTGNLNWPAVGGYISSNVGMRWGSMHKGMDIAGPSSRTIKAADNGTIVSAERSSGYGNKITIDHNNGMRTIYAHLASINVSPGQTVEKGQKIGVMGATGDSTGIHLHFEVYQNGSLQHPKKYF